AARLGDREVQLSRSVVPGVCLATDAAGFTSLAERLPASVLGPLLDGYFETLFNVVDGHGGIVSSIVGDGVMCVWTDPDPLRARTAALNAALDIAAALAAFN